MKYVFLIKINTTGQVNQPPIFLWTVQTRNRSLLIEKLIQPVVFILVIIIKSSSFVLLWNKNFSSDEICAPEKRIGSIL